MRLLLINGNRTQAVTETALTEARRVASAGTEIVGVTAAFGANIVSTVADNTIAQHAVLDALARHHRGFDAAVLAISLDSGLAAARELVSIPVIGMTEAALLTAGLLGERFGMITFGRQSTAMYLDLAERYGMTRRLAACRTIDTQSLTDYLDASAMHERIVAEAQSIAGTAGVGAIVVCGAALAGTAYKLQARIPLPLVDGIACAVRQAETLVGLELKPRRHPSVSKLEMAGITPALADLYRNA
jgi:allantoin racemase